MESIIRNHRDKRKRGTEESFLSPKKRVRSVKKYKLVHKDSNGKLKELNACDALWWLLQMSQEPCNDRKREIFTRDFD